MHTEIAMIKCLLLGCKMVAEVRELRKDRVSLPAHKMPWKFLTWRERIRGILRGTLAVVTVAFLKGSGLVYYAVTFAEQAKAMP